MPKTLYLQKNFSSACWDYLYAFCIKNDLPKIVADELPDNFPNNAFAYGSTEFVEKVLGPIVPNYYPDNLKRFVLRKIILANNRSEIKSDVSFIKPADRYKRFSGKIVEKIIDSDFPIYSSEIVHFVKEWRYYITNGQVIYVDYYKLEDESQEFVLPDLDVRYFRGMNACVDFGMLENGCIELVECHHPYSCGWYGKFNNVHLFYKWLSDGFEFMRNQKKSVDKFKKNIKIIFPY
jgi:hypothetical protein